MAPSPESEDFTKVDALVGARVRMLRERRKMSQTALGEAIGVSFQQVQKYERGANRISASKLYEIARTLRVPMGWFFEGLSDPSEGRENGADPTETTAFAHNFLLTQEGIDLANLFPRLPHRRVRRRLVDLVRAMTEEEAEIEADAEAQA